MSGNYPTDNNWSQSLTLDGDGNEIAPSNWSTSSYPNSASTDVVIPDLPVTLDVSATTGDLTLEPGATLNILGSDELYVTGNLTDNGTITCNSYDEGLSPYADEMNFNGSTVSGSGAIILQGSLGDATLTGAFTQEAGHTISGAGVIQAAFTNDGVVNSNVNVDGQGLAISGITTNNGVMEVNGSDAYLYINNTLTQGPGGQVIANGGTVLVTGTAINGGFLESSGNGIIMISNPSGPVTLNNVTNEATVEVNGNQTLNISGNLTDNGTFAVNDQESVTVMNFNGGTVSGTGTISMTADYENPELTGTFTQAAGHTINGFGIIDVTLINNGLINSNESVEALIVEGNVTNNSVIEATGSDAYLNLSGTVTQGVNGQVTSNGGIVIVTGGTINGGILDSTGSGSITVDVEDTGPATFNNITNETTIDVAGDNTLNISGSLNDNGTFVVDTGANDTYPGVMNFLGGTVSGTGTIMLDYASEAQLTGTFTQTVGHTIDGYGAVKAVLTNNGLVNANVSGQILGISGSMTNNSVMEATGVGILAITGTVTQGSNGALTSNGGTVELNGARINGGVLNSSGSGSTEIEGLSASTLNNVTNQTVVDELGGVGANIPGNLTDNGMFVVNSNSNSLSTAMTFSGGTVSGTGTILLNDAYTYSQIDGYLIQAAGHTISGDGEIAADLYNYGIVSANVSGKTLTVTLGINNFGLLNATNGGTLLFNGPNELLNLQGTTLTGGTYEADANSTITLGSTGNDGSATINAATVILSGTLSSFSAIKPLSNNEGSFSLLNGASFTTQGALANSGTLTLEGTLTVDGGLSLSSSSNFVFTLGGTQQGTNYGFAQVDGSATLAGLLELNFANNFESQLLVSDTFTLLSSETALSGSFSDVANGGTLVTEDGGASFVVNYGPGSPYGADNVVLSNATGVVPEPSEWAMLAAGAGTFFVFRRRRSGSR